MGIGTFIATRIGIPLALAVGAGAILFTFREQITTTIRGGAQVLGEAITLPIAGFVGGLKTGLEEIPSDITIPVPTIKFKFGDGNNERIKEDFEGFDPNAPRDPTFSDCKTIRGDKFGNVFCDGRLIQKGTTGPEQEPVDFMPDEGAAKLTPRMVSLPVGPFADLPRSGLIRKSVQDIIAENPNAIGLFDVLSTERTEFFPFSAEAVRKSFELGQDLRLSGQLFEEIRGVGDIV